MFISQSVASSMPLSASCGVPELAVKGKTSEFIGHLEELKHKKFKLVGIKLDADPVGKWDVNRSHMFVVMHFENKKKDWKYLRADWHKSGFTTQVADCPSDFKEYMGQQDYDADLKDAKNIILVNVKKTTIASTGVAAASGATAIGCNLVAAAATDAAASAAAAAAKTMVEAVAANAALDLSVALARGQMLSAVYAADAASATAAAAATSAAVPVAIAVGAFAILGGVVVGGLYFRSERYHANATFVAPKTIKTIEVLKGWLMDFHTPNLRYNIYDNNCQHVAKAIFHVVTEVDDDSDSDL